MKHTLQYLIWLGSILLISASSLAQEGPSAVCEDLSCLFCPAMEDPESYARGNMKLMKYLVQGRDRWLFRSEVDLTNAFSTEGGTAQLKRLVEEFRRHGTELVIVIQPTRGLMHRDKLLPGKNYGFDFARARADIDLYLSQLRASGAQVPDVMQLIDSPPAEEYFFRRDHHWTPAGARATAKLVADYVKKMPLYQGLQKTEYQTESGLTVVKDGTMNLALARLCDNHLGAQYVKGFRTIPLEVSEQALFEEQPVPEVVLVGTSNSALREQEYKQFNFDGFLKQELSVDILNYALPGSGAYGSLMQYLHSDDYRNGERPKLLLYELPVNYRIAEDAVMYRQLIPAVKGRCENDSLLKQTTKAGPMQKAQRSEILSNPQSSGLNPKPGDYLDISISDRNLRDFYLIVYYDNGSRDKTWIRREAIVDGGQYFMELSDAQVHKGARFLSVFLEPSVELTTEITVEVKLCRG